MVKTFDPDILRNKLSEYMKKNYKPLKKHAADIGISFLTLYSFLNEKRPVFTKTLFRIATFLDKEEKS